jgi:hypothetical protein
MSKPNKKVERLAEELWTVGVSELRRVNGNDPKSGTIWRDVGSDQHSAWIAVAKHVYEKLEQYE